MENKEENIKNDLNDLNKENGLEASDDDKSEAEKLLAAKELRFYGKKMEEEAEEEKEDTSVDKVKKSIGFFIDYYKWYVIIPAIIIVIATVMIVSYLEESRERALELSVINAKYDIADVVYLVEDDYVKVSPNAKSDKDLRIEINLQYPDTREDSVMNEDEVISTQKFNAMVIAGRVDAAITNTWVIDAYAVTDSAADLRDIFDEDYLKEYEDRLYYASNSKGEKVPVAFYIESEVIVNSYEEGYEPLVVTFNTSKHDAERKAFIEWINSL